MNPKMFPNKNDLKKPFTISLIVLLIIIILIYLINNINLNKISKDLSQLNTTFGTTFAAFSVTALSLLPLLQTKKWFIIFKETNDYANLITNYKTTIKINMVIIFFGIVGYFLNDAQHFLIDYIYCLISLFLITFTCIFILENIKSLIDLLTPDKK